MLVEAAVRIDRRHFDAAIFDLDGVLTDTARIHAAASRAVFDALLQRRRPEHDGEDAETVGALGDRKSGLFVHCKTRSLA